MTARHAASVLVRKREGRLYLLDASGETIAAYPIVSGRNRDGGKQREGDERTPEGEYFVCVKNPRSKFYLSLGLSYPNGADARRALAAGIIDADQCAAIEAAERERHGPLWSTPLGGEIYIHGDGEGRDGTRGCIAVSDDSVDQIFAAVDVGTPVRIEP